MYNDYNENLDDVVSKKNHNNLWIAIGFVVLVALIIGAYFLFFKKEEKLTPPEKQLEKVTPLMYEVTKEGSDNKIYLFGSIHFANINDIEFPKYLMDAYNNSDYLACEFDINKFLETVDQTELAQSYLYNDGTTLKDHVSSEMYDKIVTWVKENFGYTEEVTMKFSLTYVESLMTQYILGKSGISNNTGIDTHFIDKAHKENKEVLEVESYEFQAEMEKNFPDKYYEITIREFLNDPDKSVQELKELYAAWCGGDEKEIEKVAIEEADESKYTAEEIEIFKKVNKAMLDDRNIGMVNKFKEYFNDNKKVLYMVGAAHLVGENGIANLLKQDGYTVKIVK